MTNQEYETIAGITNSDLSTYRNLLFGNNLDYAPSENAYKLGELVHKALLSPQTLTPGDYQDLDEKQLKLLETSIKNTRQEQAWLLKWITKQRVYRWTDPTTNLICKGRIDGSLRKNTIVEIKTTATSNLPAFIKTIDTYHYDRQAAWYKDGFDAAHGTDIKFLFIAISKTSPYRVMTYQPTTQMLERGRKKYKALLKGIQQEFFTDNK